MNMENLFDFESSIAVLIICAIFVLLGAISHIVIYRKTKNVAWLEIGGYFYFMGGSMAIFFTVFYFIQLYHLPLIWALIAGVATLSAIYCVMNLLLKNLLLVKKQEKR